MPTLHPKYRSPKKCFLKGYETAGLGGLPSSFFKSGTEESELTALLGSIWTRGQVPKD